jgi:hypothetical protein
MRSDQECQRYWSGAEPDLRMGHFPITPHIGNVSGERITVMVMSRLVVMLYCAFACAAAAQESADTSNMSCIENLDVPTYPRLADLARVTASVTSAIRVGSGGRFQGVTSDVQKTVGETVRAAFLRTVEDAARTSRFAAACAGRTVIIEFRFSLGEQIGTERVSFAYPNRFTILASAKVIQGFDR